MNLLSRSIVTASAALVLLATPTVDSIASAETPEITCYTVRTDAYSLTAFANIVESGNYTADDAPWVGEEDSTIVNVGLWLHDLAAGLPTDFYADAFPVCGAS